ncbi:MAG: hypothetical protein AAGF31_11945 [Planctomycetota bacterium]
MDPLRIAIACVPLAAYMLLLGVVNLRRRPLVTSGGADLATLGAALTGFVFVGPIELFRPDTLAAELGNFVWLFWLVFYWLSLALIVLVLRPRLVVYNASIDELRPAVAEAVSQVDPTARWAGDSVSLPKLGVQLHLEGFGVMRNSSLVSSGGEQNIEGWRKLRRAVERSVATLHVRPNPRSISFFLLCTALLSISLFSLMGDPLEVAKAWQEIFAF